MCSMLLSRYGPLVHPSDFNAAFFSHQENNIDLIALHRCIAQFEVPELSQSCADQWLIPMRFHQTTVGPHRLHV